jgi:hypothetical protein
MEEESDNQINFLDLTILRKGKKLEFSIYRNPTATDIMIHSNSCYPIEHKIAGINFLINRITSYPLTNNNLRKEEHAINNLLKANGYHHSDTNTLITRKQLHTKTNNNTIANKWAVFTYTGKDTRYITKLFKEFNVNISYRTKNTIGKILTVKRRNNDPHDGSGVYQLRCQNCSCVYIGQTGSKFEV